MDRLQTLMEEKQKLLELIRRDKLSRLNLNDKQKEFVNSKHRENYLSGPNQAGGKSLSLRMKATFHLTGRYPDWYTGHRFQKPPVCMIGGETAEWTRNNLTDPLLGPSGDRGGGLIPEENIDESRVFRRKHGVTDQVESFRVRWDGPGGGESTCFVFSYGAGWDSRQGYTIDWVGIDEEPEQFMVYDELSARLNYSMGYLDLVATPMRGESEIYTMFRDDTSGLRNLIYYDIHDCTHLSEEHRNSLIEKHENHPLKEARLYGRPVSESGLIYPIMEDKIMVPAAPEGNSTRWIIGIDVAHTTGNFAIALVAYDPIPDCCYLRSCYKEPGQPRAVYIEQLKEMGGEDVPIVYPHDAHREGDDGMTTASWMAGAGLNVIPEPSHMVGIDGKRSFKVANIIDEMIERMSTGRFKVVDSCWQFMEEKRRYRHKRGKVKKDQKCDVIDATHKAVMMLRYAEGVGASRRARPSQMYRQRDFDFFSIGRGHDIWTSA